MKIFHLIKNPEEELNSKRETYCGLKHGSYPENHFWTEEHLAEVRLARKDTMPCPICFPDGRPRFGTPISEVDGRNGGNAEWRRISESWGYD